MVPTQIPVINPDDFSRCEEDEDVLNHGKILSPAQKTDMNIREYIYNALWKDDILRALDNYAIDVHVKNGVVYLNGHIVNTTSQSRIKNAIRAIPGVLGIKNNLVLDDKLILEVAESLGNLEHTYDCKFFTGATHGVVTLDGMVSNENVKSLAEKCAASVPNVRGVINHVRVSDAGPALQGQPFLQPIIGELIHFVDGLSGVVKQVIINPNNRRVIAMTVQMKFTDRRYRLDAPTEEAQPAEQLVTVPMNVVRYLTRDSGFLYIRSNEKNRYMDFDPSSFVVPKEDWVPPYPYCSVNVLFPIAYQNADLQFADGPQSLPFVKGLGGTSFKEQIIANDSLGG